VLFLFVVMMLDINLAPLKKGFYRYLPAGALVALLIVFQLVLLLGGDYFGLARMPDPAPRGIDYSNTHELGSVLYTVYLYPFEIAAVILLVAIIAAIALTMRRRKEKEFLQPEQQVLVKRGERVRLVKMSAEKK
jgi:NADH-quinone oxidoreductase subunit J